MISDLDAGCATAGRTQSPPSPIIAIADLHKSYGLIEAVKGVSLDVVRGAAQFIIGPSGCGKSTLLRCINLLETPTRGAMRVGDTTMRFGPGQKPMPVREQAAFRTRVGMVFQQFHLFPHMTVLQNVMDGAAHGQADAARAGAGHRTRAARESRSGGKAGRLSTPSVGRAAQRVAIARALAMEPEVVLFDEVTSALDPELVGEVLQVIRHLTREGMTMLIVTHEIAFAREVATGVTFMDAGVVVAEGSAEEVLDHRTDLRLQLFLRRFRA